MNLLGTKKITIGIPCYNDPQHLDNLLRSVSLQDKGLIAEVLIIDDGSNPKLNVTSFHFDLPLRLVTNSKNMGTGYSRNKILSEAQSRYILFVDSDCELPRSDFLEELVAKIGESEILFPAIVNVDGSMVHPRNSDEMNYPRMSTTFLIDRNALLANNLMFNNYFNFFFEDEDFFIRCQMKGLKAEYINKLQVLHVQPITGIGHRKFGYQEWYNLYSGLIYMKTFHSKKYFKTQNLTWSELAEVLKYCKDPKFGRPRLFALLMAGQYFFFRFPLCVWRRYCMDIKN